MSIVDKLGEFEKPHVQVSGRAHISEVGMRKINTYLEGQGIAGLPKGFPRLVESRMGKMATRVQAYMRAVNGKGLTAKQVETIGNYADANIYHGKSMIYDFTYEVLTWDNGSFGNGGSCWRTSHASSIPMFREGSGHGPGFALRVYKPAVSGQWYEGLDGYGRCWCMAVDNDAMIVFNQYGEKLTVFASIVVNALPEGEYEMKGIEAKNETSGIYMNNSSAALIYPVGHKIGNKAKIVLKMPKCYTRECHQCHSRFGTTHEDRMYCEKCAVPCVVTGVTVGFKTSAYLENINFEWRGVSYHVTQGHLKDDIAEKVLDFCYDCMRHHGNLDECDAK